MSLDPEWLRQNLMTANRIIADILEAWPRDRPIPLRIRDEVDVYLMELKEELEPPRPQEGTPT